MVKSIQTHITCSISSPEPMLTCMFWVTFILPQSSSISINNCNAKVFPCNVRFLYCISPSMLFSLARGHDSNEQHSNPVHIISPHPSYHEPSPTSIHHSYNPLKLIGLQTSCLEELLRPRLQYPLYPLPLPLPHPNAFRNVREPIQGKV